MIMYEFPSFGQNPIYLVVDVHKYLWVLNEGLKSQVHISAIFFGLQVRLHQVRDKYQTDYVDCNIR